MLIVYFILSRYNVYIRYNLVVWFCWYLLLSTASVLPSSRWGSITRFSLRPRREYQLLLLPGQHMLQQSILYIGFEPTELCGHLHRHDLDQSGMSLQFEYVSSRFIIGVSSTEVSLTIAALAIGKFDPWYDKFNYALNTTQCADGSICPFKDNHSCCDTEQGIHEIHYNYTNKAVMPSNIFELTAFYASAGYTFPTSIPSTSALPSVTRL